MKNNLWYLTKDITKSAAAEINYFFIFNLRYLGIILEALCPFITYLIGQYVVLDRGYFAVGGELAIPIIILLTVYYLKEISSRYNRGARTPIPMERFTEVNAETGEVNVRQDRLQEMILYVADVEDWLERKGWL